MKGFDFKVGFTCNNDCIHCVVGSKRNTEDLTTEEIFKILDEKVIGKYDSVGFTGGEVSIRKDAVEIFKHAKEGGLYVAVQTNATGFADEEMTKEASKYVDSALVALHSCYKDVHNRIVGDESGLEYSMFERTMDGFYNLLKYGVYCRTQTVISKWNINTLPDTYKFIQSVHPGIYMNLTYPHAMGNAYKNWKIVCPKYSDIKDVIHKCLKDFGEFISTEAIPYCYLYPYEKKIIGNSDERVFSKSTSAGIDMSNKHLKGDNSLFDEDGITEDYAFNDITAKVKAPRCRECVFFKECVGVWKEYYEFYKNELDLYPIKGIDPKFIGNSCALALYGKDKMCNSVCLFCQGFANSGGTDESYFESFKKQADEHIKQGAITAEISGQPSLNKYMIDAVLYLKNNGIKQVQISTNGRTLSDENLVIKLKEIGDITVRVPLYGSTKEIHEKIEWSRDPSKSSFDEVIKGLENCGKHGLRVAGNTLLTEYNKNDLGNIINLYYKLCSNMKEMVVGFVGISNLDDKTLKDWYVPIKDAKEYLLKILDDDSPAYDEVKILGFPYCAIGRYDDRFQSIFYAPNMNPDLIMGSNKTKTSKKIPHYIERIRIPQCELCVLSDECSGTIKNDDILFGSESLKPILETN